MTAAPWSRVSRPQPLLRDTVWTTHRLRYPASMQPLTPSQVLDHTEGQMRSCEPGYCDLWLVSAKVDIPNREILESVLSTNEREHADRFRFEADCVRSIVARGGLRRILSSYCPASPHAMEFHTGSHGKPALLRPSAALEFNISHSGDCVLIAVTSGVPCGVDIEHGRPITAEREIAERLFCPRELEWLSRTQNGFRRLWALKEAIIKAMGLGLCSGYVNFSSYRTTRLQLQQCKINAFFALCRIRLNNQFRKIWVSQTAKLRTVPSSSIPKDPSMRSRHNAPYSLRRCAAVNKGSFDQHFAQPPADAVQLDFIGPFRSLGQPRHTKTIDNLGETCCLIGLLLSHEGLVQSTGSKRGGVYNGRSKAAPLHPIRARSLVLSGFQRPSR
jgi:4'-phosphopantetheinyl transferase